jgi:glycosyltransferase involved in cell wall biosynthesis
MKKVASIVLNNFVWDNRVLKENLSLKKGGFETKIFALYEDNLKEEDVVEGIEVKRIVIKDYKWIKSVVASALKYFSFVYKAYKLTKSYDIIHCNDLETLPIGYFVKLFNRKTKIVYDAHEFEIYRSSHSHPTRLWLNKKIERCFINSVDVVITVSDSIAEEYAKIYNITKPQLIYNCPSNEYSIEGSFDLFRERYSLEAEQKIFLYQGALTFGRGIEVILESFSRMRTDENIVVFMGYGKYEYQIKEAAKNTNNIFLHPAVEMAEIDKYSRSADWGLVTIEPISRSYNLSLPNKLFEYAMAEIPILAFPTLEIKNKINQYHLGIVSNDFTVEAFTAAIQLASNTDERSFNNSLKKMKLEYNWENQEKKLINIYKSLY